MCFHCYGFLDGFTRILKGSLSTLSKPSSIIFPVLTSLLSLVVFYVNCDILACCRTRLPIQFEGIHRRKKPEIFFWVNFLCFQFEFEGINDDLHKQMWSEFLLFGKHFHFANLMTDTSNVPIDKLLP